MYFQPHREKKKKRICAALREFFEVIPVHSYFGCSSQGEYAALAAPQLSPLHCGLRRLLPFTGLCLDLTLQRPHFNPSRLFMRARHWSRQVSDGNRVSDSVSSTAHSKRSKTTACHFCFYSGQAVQYYKQNKNSKYAIEQCVGQLAFTKKMNNRANE